MTRKVARRSRQVFIGEMREILAEQRRLLELLGRRRHGFGCARELLQ